MSCSIIGRLLFAAFIITLTMTAAQLTQPTHASTGFEEKFFMSRACPEGYWEVDTINQDESSVTMRCEESQ
jgi:hypothetical protein